MMAKYNILEKKTKIAAYRELVNATLMDELKEKILDIILIRQKYKDKDYSAKQLAADLGTQVKATADGVVAGVYDDDLFGTTVVIAHGGGLQSVYANLAALPTVKEGDAVVAGQVIGAVGDTALGETGEVTHLHFAMSLDGESVDPGDYLP